MELEKIRNMSDEELKHQEKTSAEQLFRLRFQVSLGQNDGVKTTSSVKTSRRPISIARISTHLPNGVMVATLAATALRPGPVLLIAPATADRAVSASRPVAIITQVSRIVAPMYTEKKPPIA